jgi:hypothetical protein
VANVKKGAERAGAINRGVVDSYAQSSASAHSRRKTFAVGPQKSWNIKPSERLAIALQSPGDFVIWRSKS